MTLRKSLHKLLGLLHSDRFRRFGELLGIDTFLERADNWLQSAATPDRHEISIATASATLDTSSIGEYRRATTFVEEDALADFIEALHADDVFWDIGANTGIYSCLAGDVITAGTIYAFEPHPANVDSLTSNVSLNGLENVEIRRYALSDETGDMALTVTSTMAGTGLHSLRSEDAKNTIQIETHVGDELVEAGHEVPTVVKIDVEGGEGNVIDGMSETLARPECRLIYCEIHASKSLPNHVYDFGHTPEEIEARLREAGFSLGVIDEGNAYMIKGTKTPEV